MWNILEVLIANKKNYFFLQNKTLKQFNYKSVTFLLRDVLKTT